MYHWSKNAASIAGDEPDCYRYKGLIFLRFEGQLKPDQYRSRDQYFAFYGNRALTRGQIRYHVGLMIKRGVYAPPQAA